ncbi:class I adenylate-forming enzyme family protein [Azorhizobium doebereinerae]|uniref:class I adenylate-forming enzyme family protein n=1 Tax=Azorhizobium doebereinerae TaxID=281091 RepID=UPI000417E1CB|nr:class I adenylate-forming enzyme family protein [Azorhizobium doebereinerae]
MHLGSLFHRTRIWHGPRIAIVDEAGPWTFEAFLGRIARFGRAMDGLGLARGDRIALLMPDIREYLEADYGAMAGGFVRVPMDPKASRAEILAQLRHVGARLLVADASLAPVVEGLDQEVATLDHVVAVRGTLPGAHDYEGLLSRAADRFLPPGHGSDLASLNFSGGTTGRPKAIMLRHDNLAAVVQHVVSGFNIHADSVFLNVRPLWPIAQVISLSYLLAGARVVLGGRFDPERFPFQMARFSATRTSLVPTQLMRALDHLAPDDVALNAMEALHVGGSRIPEVVFDRAMDLMGPRIGTLYGLTEAPVTCYLQPERLAGKKALRCELRDTVGKPFFSYEVKLAGVDPDATHGGSGEVLVRGPHVMAGYWNDREATAATLVDGWLHTGDVGQFTERGDLSIVGRIKDVIRTGSTSVVTKEVEDAIARHPAVREVAVIGVPDLEWGEAVTAFIVLKEEGLASTEELVAFCRCALAGPKRPKSVHLRRELPRSHYGKVLRQELIASLGATATGQREAVR